MNIILHTKYELFKKLRTIRLKGFGQPLAYPPETTKMELVTEQSSAIVTTFTPAQFYYLQPHVERILGLRETIWELHGIDILRLPDSIGYIDCVLKDGTTCPFLPPIVEQYSSQSVSNPLYLICDGIHRIQAAMQTGSEITVVRISQPPFPYYALPNPNGWADTERIDALPTDASFVKKLYRLPTPDLYKQLFRDFNAAFPGVQEERPKGLIA